VGWTVLVLALARPQSGRQQEVIRGQGLDIVLALDISSSMNALDFEPQNRLEAAKNVIADFIRGREFDRVGLVVFAEDAYHHVPPTLDYDLLVDMLSEVKLSTEYGLQSATAIGTGIASAANMLRSSDSPSKVIILLTDGVNNAEGVSPIEAAKAAAALDMRVYTIGMGRLGLVQQPSGNGGFQLVESELDEATLQAIAEISDGLYFRAENYAGLQQTYDQIDALERSDIERQIFVRWQERAFPFILVAMAALVLERVLRYTVLQVIP
jgi:Ca-activated chloride channel family protein